jgi:hypothetical protein
MQPWTWILSFDLKATLLLQTCKNLHVSLMLIFEKLNNLFSFSTGY